MVASESCALMTIGAQFIRDIEPGEIVTIGADGLTSYKDPGDGTEQALCVFEYIYFARPDSVIEGTAALPGAPEYGPRACPRAPGRSRHRDRRARLRHPRRHWLRARIGHPLQRRPDQEPLHRPNLHPAQPDNCASAASASSSTPCPKC